MLDILSDFYTIKKNTGNVNPRAQEKSFRLRYGNKPMFAIFIKVHIFGKSNQPGNFPLLGNLYDSIIASLFSKEISVIFELIFK